MDRELVAEWVRFADDDIDTVLLLKEMRPQHREIICYHCEQAVEKYLKGFLSFKDQIPPKIHDLIHLCHLCMEYEAGFSSLLMSCSYLTDFSVLPRYPKEMDISDANVEKAIRFALDVKEFGEIVGLRE